MDLLKIHRLYYVLNRVNGKNKSIWLKAPIIGSFILWVILINDLIIIAFLLVYTR